MPSPLGWVLLFLAAVLGGALNAVAGGGTFFTFPTLVFTGVLPVNANATSTVALWPGAWASVAAYRRELSRHNRPLMLALGSASALGGLIGSLLLLNTPQATFVRIVPYLLLVATVLFAFGGRFIRWLLRSRGSMSGQGQTTKQLAAIWLGQLVIATYGGYFGGGLGIVMLAAFVAMGFDNLQEMNALKTLMAAFVNGVAVVVFIASGVVFWPQAIAMFVGSVVGGYGAASIARQVDPRWVRWFVIATGVAMTIIFFLR